MAGCQNYGPFLGPYCNAAPSIQGTQKGTTILTTTHVFVELSGIRRARSELNGLALGSLSRPLP